MGTLVVAAVVGAALGYECLRDLPRYEVNCAVLSLPPARSWADVQLRHALATSFPNLGRRRICDDALLDELSRALEASQWVRRVVVIQRRHPSRVQAEVELRHPAAAVRLGERLLLVDEEHVRLPGSYRRMPEVGYVVPVITGVGQPEPPPAGVVWRAEGLAGGCAVARLLLCGGLYHDLVVHEIDVSWNEEYQSRLVTIIAGAHRTRVLWGKSPLEPDPVEVSTSGKLASLRLLRDRFPGLAGLREVDITLDEVILEDAATVSGVPGPGEISAR